MSAYCFFDVLEITDAAKIQEYVQRVEAVVQEFGGRYLVRGGKMDVKEGAWRPVLPVLIEFPTLEKAHQWYNSDEYRGLKALRFSASRCNAVFIEGL